jgi:taurine--2-oxoglutarate transaminase
MPIMDEISKVAKEHTFGTWKKQREWNPITVTKAEGVYFYDSQ